MQSKLQFLTKVPEPFDFNLKILKILEISNFRIF